MYFHSGSSGLAIGLGVPATDTEKKQDERQQRLRIGTDCCRAREAVSTEPENNLLRLKALYKKTKAPQTLSSHGTPVEQPSPRSLLTTKLGSVPHWNGSYVHVAAAESKLAVHDNCICSSCVKGIGGRFRLMR